LEIVTTARAATAQSHYLVIGLVQAKMDKTGGVGLLQYFKRLRKRDLTSLSLLDKLLSDFIKNKADFQRLIAPVIMGPADAFC
jgi:hypothetical protein